MYDKVYQQKNKIKIRIREKEYRKSRSKDLSFILSKNLRKRLWDHVKGSSKIGSHVKDLGCTIEELKTHLEQKFKPGMSWDNYGFYGWHIDHIKPLSSFDLTDREQFLEACHYTNLQPLWAEENLKKNNK